ncbi:MAG: hypothetical protein QOI70_1562 [Microbacteriaceae bacterium]|nr:hypothetical protein [Microbacteriaceae bacterium]
MTEPAATPRSRREKSAIESLLSIALLLEAILIFFVVMVAFGLKVLPPAAVFGGGAALFVIMLVTGRLVRFPWAVWAGWVLQAVLIGIGVLLPLMYFIGAVFCAIWIYCFLMGRKLDRQKAAYLANPNKKE